MKFSYTHHMPYTAIDEAGQDWPVPNKQFDPARGVGLYREYMDSKVQAEDVGFEWLGCNEHHMSPYGLMPNTRPPPPRSNAPRRRASCNPTISFR